MKPFVRWRSVRVGRKKSQLPREGSGNDERHGGPWRVQGLQSNGNAMELQVDRRLAITNQLVDAVFVEMEPWPGRLCLAPPDADLRAHTYFLPLEVPPVRCAKLEGCTSGASTTTDIGPRGRGTGTPIRRIARLIRCNAAPRVSRFRAVSRASLSMRAASLSLTRRLMNCKASGASSCCWHGRRCSRPSGPLP